MSIRIMAVVWNTKNLSPDEKLILLSLADNADDDGKSWWSMRRIGERCGEMSRGKVIRILKSLETKNYIKRYNRFEEKRQTSNMYIVRTDVVGARENQFLDKPKEIEIVPVSIVDPEKSNPKGCSTYRTGGCSTYETGGVSYVEQAGVSDVEHKSLIKTKYETKEETIAPTAQEPAAPDESPVQEKPSENEQSPEAWFQERSIPQTPRQPLSVDAYKERIASAIERGTTSHTRIEADIERSFRITPNFKRKDWSACVQYLKSVPQEQEVSGFAKWWYANDWRGKQGQSPTAAQITELWPQAFAANEPEYIEHDPDNPDGSLDDAHVVQVRELRIKTSTFEQTYLALTGQGMEQEEACQRAEEASERAVAQNRREIAERKRQNRIASQA